MDYNFDFTDRDTYVAYRNDWRARYKAITLEIRQNKRDQAANKGGDNSLLQSRLHYARRRANQLMLERTAATEYKNQQLATLVAEAA